MGYRNSPTAKRNIKPSPISASTSHFALSASDPSSLHPLNQAPQQNLDSFNPFPQQTQIQQQHNQATVAQPANPRKRRAEGPPGVAQPQNVSIAPASSVHQQPPQAGPSSGYADSGVGAMATASTGRPAEEQTSPTQPPAKKGRTNTPWTPAEEQRLKQMRDAGNSWSEIAKVRKISCLQEERIEQQQYFASRARVR